uniref:Transposase Tc1-like domain-containing protein n=1 Tax=Oreochromis aureus TaxID=47969 RepID=A0A668T4Y3_OREAU
MVKRRELTEKDRVQIKCSHSVVKYALESVAETGTYRMRQGRGRKQKPTDADVQHLKILSTSDRRKTTADLQVELNASRSESEKVSRMTISRSLNEQGLNGRVAAKKQLLRAANIQKPLRFPRECRHWTVDDWNKVLWTDESEVFDQGEGIWSTGTDGLATSESRLESY